RAHENATARGPDDAASFAEERVARDAIARGANLIDSLSLALVAQRPRERASNAAGSESGRRARTRGTTTARATGDGIEGAVAMVHGRLRSERVRASWLDTACRAVSAGAEARARDHDRSRSTRSSARREDARGSAGANRSTAARREAPERTA